MNRILRLMATSLLAAIAAGCSSTPEKEAAPQPRDDRPYTVMQQVQPYNDQARVAVCEIAASSGSITAFRAMVVLGLRSSAGREVKDFLMEHFPRLVHELSDLELRQIAGLRLSFQTGFVDDHTRVFGELDATSVKELAEEELRKRR